jgi:hypothetical protein
MAAPPSAYKDRQFLAIIGDEVKLKGFRLQASGLRINA